MYQDNNNGLYKHKARYTRFHLQTRPHVCYTQVLADMHTQHDIKLPKGKRGKRKGRGKGRKEKEMRENDIGSHSMSY